MNSREIPTSIGEEFARRHDMHFIETSAKEAENVELLFIEIAKQLTKEARNNDLKSDGNEDKKPSLENSIPLNWNCCWMK